MVLRFPLPARSGKFHATAWMVVTTGSPSDPLLSLDRFEELEETEESADEKLLGISKSPNIANTAPLTPPTTRNLSIRSNEPDDEPAAEDAPGRVSCGRGWARGQENDGFTGLRTRRALKTSGLVTTDV